MSELGERSAADAGAVDPGVASPAAPKGYRYYVLGILLVVYVFNFIDRQILSILMEPVRLELGLSDTQLGFLSGIAFALFYATLGIPIARIADRTSRTGVISICLALWSLMTAVCGLAQSFWQLLAARIGVAVGEAGGSPPSHSLIADYFQPSERATALGIFALGVPIGVMFGLFVGGWANEFLGWRITFMLVGLPGVALAVVVWLTVREPRRTSGAQRPPEVSIRDVFGFLWSQRSFRYMALASSVHAFVGYGIAQWYPVFFIRSHGMSTGEVGTYLAFVIGLFGGLGTFLGGYVADRLAARDRRWYMWLPLLATGFATPFFFGIFLAPTFGMAFLYMMIPTMLTSFYLGPVFSMTQGLVPPAMRATAAAVLLFIVNIIGLGLGPQFAGILSDLLRPTFAADSLRYALLIMSMFTLLGAVLYGFAARSLRDDLARVETLPAR
jgi:predicted MFS family arabinose efflux permease